MNNSVDGFAIRKGWKNEEKGGLWTQFCVTRFVARASRSLESEVFVHCRTDWSVAQYWSNTSCLLKKRSSKKLQRKCWFSNSLDFSSRCASFFKLSLCNCSCRATELSPLGFKNLAMKNIPTTRPRQNSQGAYVAENFSVRFLWWFQATSVEVLRET